jgi:hypothetical protein
MDKGWIKLHRQLLESEVFASEKALKIWIWILLKANFKNRFVPLRIGAGQSVVEIGRGQLLFGRFSAEDELGINGSTIYKWIKKMEQSKMITIESNSHYTVITVCNYDVYNQDEEQEVTAVEQPSNNTVTTEEQHGNTPKKEKKEKIYLYNEFYDQELKKSNNDPNYLLFVKILFGENEDKKVLKGVLSIKEQLTYEQFLSCLQIAKENDTRISEKLLMIDNDRKYYKDKVSLNRTLKNWLNNRFVQK